MKATITAIYKWEAAKVFHEFFTEDFRTQQLGQPGRWHILGDRPVSVPNPVEAFQVETLIEKASAKYPDDHPVAYRLNLEAGRSVTTIWASTSKPMSERIEEAHDWAVQAALADWLPGIARGWEGGSETKPDAAFALFRSGTGMGQIPYLHTTAFLFGSSFSPTSNCARLSSHLPEGWEGSLDTASALRHECILTALLGRLDCSDESSVPRRLFPELFAEPLNLARGQQYADYGGPFRGEEIRGQWRRLADAGGFGPAQIESVLRHARAEAMRVHGIDSAFFEPTAEAGESQGIRPRRDGFKGVALAAESEESEVEELARSSRREESRRDDLSHSH